jgi:heptaprenylglyceryl phosphate synthase
MNKLISTAFAACLLLTSLVAQNGSVTVVHGIPNLPKPVEVFANGAKLFSFDFGDSEGPLSLPPATYTLEVKLDGNTVLSADAKVEADTSYTVVAHLKETSGIALAVFVNDTTNVSRYKSRVYVRHLANAPSVDVLARRWWRTSTLFENVSNGQEVGGDVYSGSYYVSLNAAGTKTRAFGPAKLSLSREKIYAVHAIGELGTPSFGLFVQELEETVTKPKLVTKIRGTACGGKISLSTNAVEFDQNFDVMLSGGTANGIGILHSGMSDSRFLLFRLPFNLKVFGAPGCFLYQNTQILRPVRLDANGDVKVTTKIPSAYAGWFREMHYQYSFQAKNKNSLGLQLTDYASVERDN